MLAGGVNLYENGRVDRVFEKVRPRSLVGGGTSVYVRRGTGSVEELPTAGFYSFVVEEI